MSDDLRTIWNAIQCLAASGYQWRLLPRDFPPFTTVQRRFYRWPRLRVCSRRSTCHRLSLAL
ncbi:transposase [Sinorhizobium alkalisoli]|uniref:transposase n=1 Tax=Sinorhizobium alkalisoli TaxID=1752398 RepID=UPI0013F4CD85|nr:transposase [Sinorhizobium alkalisoli]